MQSPFRFFFSFKNNYKIIHVYFISKNSEIMIKKGFFSNNSKTAVTVIIVPALYVYLLY